MATTFFPSTMSIQIRLNRTQSPSLFSNFLPTPTPTPTPTPILSNQTPNRGARDMVVRMGGGPRTFPGGVSKWQWKRMQEKKAQQLLKARLLRERQIYDMRKRAELKTALTQLERPWEAVQKAPNLFSVGADEQVKTLADRFQKPGGFDMWNERDGPQLFKRPDEELTSVRFFPKGVVHSIKPYTKEGEDVSAQEQGGQLRFDDWIAKGAGNVRKTRPWRDEKTIDVECTRDVSQNVSKENYDTNQRRNGSNVRNIIDVKSTEDVWENPSKNFSTEGGKAGIDKRKITSNWFSVGFSRQQGGNMEHRQGTHQNISKNEVTRFKPGMREGYMVDKRNAERNLPISGTFRAKRTMKHTTGARQNVSKNETRWKQVEREGDFKAERNGRYTSYGNTKSRRVTATSKHSSNLSNEERIEK